MARRPLDPRACPTCGQAFQPAHHSQRYCRPAHRPDRVERPYAYARGYGPEHRAERRRWEPAVAAGRVECREVECRVAPDRDGDRTIRPGEPWDLAHAEGGGYLGPAHRRCNRREGGVRGAAVTNALGAGRTPPRGARRRAGGAGGGGTDGAGAEGWDLLAELGLGDTPGAFYEADEWL